MSAISRRASARIFTARRAAIFGAACAGLVIAGCGQAFASAGCDAVNAGGFNVAATGTANFIAEVANFGVGDNISFTVTGNGKTADFQLLNGPKNTALLTVSLTTSPQTANYIVTGSNGDTTLDVFHNIYQSGSLLTVTATCVAAVSSTTNTDSTNVRTLQTTFTKAAAIVSGQVVTTQISGAIADAFTNGGNPISFGANGMTINFAAEPKSEIAARTDDAFSALAYTGSSYKAPPRKSMVEREWSAWLDLRGTGWQNHDPNAGMNGNQINVTGGVGRKLTPDFLVGIFSGYEYFKYNVAALAGNIKGTGGTIGSYLGWRVTSAIRFDAALGYTRMSYSATAGTATGSFNGNRMVASSGLTGTYGLGVFKLEPSASIYALWEQQSAWTDSLGTAQADRKFSAGRTSTGARIIREWAYGDMKVAPYAGFYGDWRFSSDNAVVAGTPVVGIGDGWSGRATAGVAITGRTGASLALGGEYGGISAAYKIWTGNVRATMPF